MSPILLRPIREQFEHDRVIRQLQTRWRRRFAVSANPGTARDVTVRTGSQTLYPDLILTSTEGKRRLHGVVEVETTESINYLEAMAQWAYLAKARGAFYLYVPAGVSDVARRLCEEHGINVTEIWTYYAVGSLMRFTMVYRSAGAKRAAATKAARRVGSKARKAPRKATTKKAKASRTAKTPRKTKASPRRASMSKTATKRTSKAAPRPPLSKRKK